MVLQLLMLCHGHATSQPWACPTTCNLIWLQFCSHSRVLQAATLLHQACKVTLCHLCLTYSRLGWWHYLLTSDPHRLYIEWIVWLCFLLLHGFEARRNPVTGTTIVQPESTQQRPQRIQVEPDDQKSKNYKTFQNTNFFLAFSPEVSYYHPKKYPRMAAVNHL